ncbi:MAG: TetR/AcrR family transcriptional regulator [Eubacterium sp.]|nr:TetR/AcrR family transcriptional regulator [Eubacterium sp.]
MPKVTQEYIDNKKKFIVDAAYRVCLRKPVEMVTMMDVIEEAGLSQGGIYRFYKDLEEILSDVIAGMRMNYNIIDEMEQLFGASDEMSFEEGVYKIFGILADVMENHLMDIQKINFDLTVLAINEPERAEKILGGIKGKSSLGYLSTVALPNLFKESKKRKYKLRDKPENIANFISATYTGIEMNCILTACYKAPMGAQCKPRPLFETLAKSIIYLCGGEE